MIPARIGSQAAWGADDPTTISARAGRRPRASSAAQRRQEAKTGMAAA